VDVVATFDGATAPSKLSAEVTGAGSVDPSSLNKTPGTITYTAPDEINKQATILLEAKSKRGKAKLELAANTGASSYRAVDSSAAGRTWKSDCIDDLSKPFTVLWTSPEGSGDFSFSPSTSTAGSVAETSHMTVGNTTMDYSGSGAYEIVPTDKDANGNVTSMTISYSTAGEQNVCIDGNCVSSDRPAATGIGIPLRVQKGTCAQQ
jgi:hypothetical protein